MCWGVLEDGVKVQEGVLDGADVGPNSSGKPIKVDYDDGKFVSGKEYILEFSANLKSDTNWADKGYEVAFEQFVIRESDFTLPEQAEGTMACSNLDREFDISGDGFVVTFDIVDGVISSLIYDGKKVLERGPVGHFWRAPTDNDGFTVHKARSFAANWGKAGLDKLSRTILNVDYSRSEKKATVTVKAIYCKDLNVIDAAGFNTLEVYTVLPSGSIKLEIDIDPFGNMPEDLPRIGTQMIACKDLEYFNWYGRGPEHSYADRKTGVKFGIYSGTVDEQFVPYPAPQEFGNKSDVRWFTLSDKDGKGIKVTAGRPLDVTVSHYATENLTEAYHLYDLVRMNECFVNVDYANAPLGNASCRIVPPIEPYRLKPHHVKYSYTIEKCE